MTQKLTHNAKTLSWGGEMTFKKTFVPSQVLAQTSASSKFNIPQKWNLPYNVGRKFGLIYALIRYFLSTKTMQIEIGKRWYISVALFKTSPTVYLEGQADAINEGTVTN